MGGHESRIGGESEHEKLQIKLKQEIAGSPDHGPIQRWLTAIYCCGFSSVYFLT